MATYVNDLRLKEIATGDESGTWGARTNENLELIGEALGFGTEAITTNADTHSTVVADGASDAGRAATETNFSALNEKADNLAQAIINRANDIDKEE